MSEYLKSAIVTAATSYADALHIMRDVIATLTSHYQFDFRGYGGVSRLVFANQAYMGLEPISAASEVAGVEDSELDPIASQHRWFQLSGAFRLPDALRLYDVAVSIFPASQSGDRACIITHLDASIYNDLWSDDDIDYINMEAAATLKSLAIRFGAHKLTDGFNIQNIEILSDVVTFSGPELLDCLVNPTSIQQKRDNDRLLSHNSVSGIKNTLCSAALLRSQDDGEVLETITGHVVVSTLIEIDPGLLEGLDD